LTIAGELMEVILYVRDMETQVSFYRDVLGIPVKGPAGVQDFGELVWVELDTGSCTLALHGGGDGRFGTDAPKVVFRVSDVAASRARLVEVGVTMGDVRSAGPGIQVCDGQDPEGNQFSIESRERV
jgi:catechol 2,3-dioxygenase-like lactoylglutathione lyase family enzyme